MKAEGSFSVKGAKGFDVPVATDLPPLVQRGMSRAGSVFWLDGFDLWDDLAFEAGAGLVASDRLSRAEHLDRPLLEKGILALRRSKARAFSLPRFPTHPGLKNP